MLYVDDKEYLDEIFLFLSVSYPINSHGFYSAACAWNEYYLCEKTSISIKLFCRQLTIDAYCIAFIVLRVIQMLKSTKEIQNLIEKDFFSAKTFQFNLTF